MICLRRKIRNTVFQLLYSLFQSRALFYAFCINSTNQQNNGETTPTIATLVKEGENGRRRVFFVVQEKR